MFVATVLTLFPEMFPGTLGFSLAGDSLSRGLWSLETCDLRSFGIGKHKVVDDTPAGGGVGMVLRADVLSQALDSLEKDSCPHLIMSPRGIPFSQKQAREWSQGPGLVIVCPRFEGFDERIVQGRNLLEVSIGDYVLSGGEVAALTILDACVRLIPGVMGKQASGESESFEEACLEYPHYTRPRLWEGRAIPEVLLSGHHADIARWRQAESLRLTHERRPDLLKRSKI